MVPPTVVLTAVHGIAVRAKTNASGAMYRASVAATAALAVGAFVLSFVALRDLAVTAGIAPELAALLPLVIDLAVAVATTALVAVRKWRRRFAAAGLPALEDRPRSGRRRGFTPVQVAEVKALACTLPAETGAPLSRWSSAELASEVITRGIAETISAATVRRWLAADAIKPWQHRSWIFPRDPDFAIKAARVLDLYARQWGGQPADFHHDRGPGGNAATVQCVLYRREPHRFGNVRVGCHTN